MNAYIEKFIHYFTDQGVSRGVAITYLIVSALIVVMAIVTLVMRIIVIINYFVCTYVNCVSACINY